MVTSNINIIQFQTDVCSGINLLVSLLEGVSTIVVVVVIPAAIQVQ